MNSARQSELFTLADKYFKIASSHLNSGANLSDELRKAIKGTQINEEAEVPGFEERPMKFGKFVNRKFVILMTDIRKSTDLINQEYGIINMFLIFYIYAGIVAKIVDTHKGTSTEFLGDGVLNLFDTENIGLDRALMNSMGAALEIMDARHFILNPFFSQVGLPNINLGIGIDHGVTIVTKFGYRNDTDLKAFGRCVYNAAKYCKGYNTIYVSEDSKTNWPITPGGKLIFGTPIQVEDKLAYPARINQI